MASLQEENTVENVTKENFMQEVQKYPIVYDKFRKDFKNVDMKKNAWKKIGEAFGMTDIEAEKKYTNIRSAYGRALRKNKKIGSGSGRNAVNSDYDYLQWLNVYIDHRETTSNLVNSQPPYKGMRVDLECSPGTSQITSKNDTADDSYDLLDRFLTSDNIGENINDSNNSLDELNESDVVGNASQNIVVIPKSSTKGKKRNRETLEEEDEIATKSILSTMQEIYTYLKSGKCDQEEQDEVALFCRSLEPSLRRLTPGILAIIKVQIQQLVLKAEYPLI